MGSACVTASRTFVRLSNKGVRVLESVKSIHMCLSILESVEEVQDLSVIWIIKVHRERSGNHFLIMWYQIARLITVHIALLLGCFYSVVVATIGYVVAMLLVKIEEEEVGGKGEAGRIARNKVLQNLCHDRISSEFWGKKEGRSDRSGGRRHDPVDRSPPTGRPRPADHHQTGLPGATAGQTGCQTGATRPNPGRDPGAFAQSPCQPGRRTRSLW
ncbi:hypothetical protein QYE76_070072 [Lolium multiflorum]|uniref:Uncharacterized protein n=1 Tax=Lolium multiflorum TaxID=4521 RepID=A0AAD8SHJ5_LOLMU|nr:hypothetical protein QYE76_070072 [Lolium multiflorum]